ncbi:MAG TPA: ABC transporter substrate-binding protein [Acetobacteraceae bacterium]|nr:ABC transporter substrate-binding protein [Acetobacteraceae bacterium]
MSNLSRRSVLQRSLAVAAAGTLGRPYIANAAATTVTAWWTQGFVPEEDVAIKKLVAEYEKQSGDTIDLSIVPFGPLGQKVVSAITSGSVPDVMSYDGADGTIVPQNAWIDKLIDLSDIVEKYKSEYSPTVNLAAQYFNNVTKKRGYYIAPYKTACVPFHIWGDLVEQAGYKLSDAPKTWNAYWDFFKPMQAKLREKGHRGLYSLGLQITSTGPADGNNLFYGFVLANGGRNFISPDGRTHFDDPQVKEAVIKSIEYMTTAYKQGFVPPGVLSWNDADDNNAFHAKEILMDFDGTISTEVAMFHDKKRYYHEAVTQGLPMGNDGQTVPAQIGALGCFMAKGAKNVAGGKQFIAYICQPKVANIYLKEGLGRWLPAMPSIVKNDPFWLDPKDPHRPPYVKEGLLGPTLPGYQVFNPGVAVANAQQVWGQAQADVIRNGMTPQAAAAKGFKAMETILGNYKIVQS